MRPTDQLPSPLPSAEPGGHLPVALLRQYVAGTLAPADQHRVEAHTLDCERCAEVLEGLEMTDATTTDHSLADLQSRLRTRVAQDTGRKTAADWPWLQMAGALLLLIASLVGWRLNQAKTEAQSEPVAAMMRREEAASSQQEAAPLVASKPELEAMESTPMPAEIAAADVAQSDAARPTPSRAPASARTKAIARTSPARIAAPANADIAAIRTQDAAMDAMKDKAVPDSASTPNVAAVSEAPAVAYGSSPTRPGPHGSCALGRWALPSTQVNKWPKCPPAVMRGLWPAAARQQPV